MIAARAPAEFDPEPLASGLDFPPPGRPFGEFREQAFDPISLLTGEQVICLR
jgi:hypothetical protein